MKTFKGKTLAVIALAGILGLTVSTPARADWGPRGNWHHEAWHDHAYHNHAWYVAHPYYEPAYVAAPPPVVYAPPPSPGISLILPIHIH